MGQSAPLGASESVRHHVVALAGQHGPACYEAWYAGMLCACCRIIGLDTRVEDSSSRSRMDMVVLHGGQVFVFKFKIVDVEDDTDPAARQAIEQIRGRGYAEKYKNRNEPVDLIGAAFGRGRSPAAVTDIPRLNVGWDRVVTPS